MQNTTMPPPPTPTPTEPEKTEPDPPVSPESGGTAAAATKSEGTAEESGRERLKRHRVEVAGRVWIPDMWGQEDFLKDMIDCAAFDASLVNSSIVLARDSLMRERRAANSTTLRIQNGC